MAVRAANADATSSRGFGQSDNAPAKRCQCPDLRCRLLTIYNAPAIYAQSAPRKRPLPHPTHDRPRSPIAQTSSLANVVQQEVERAILAGESAAGQQADRGDVAGRMGVSRGPVREAFRALEESGLVRNEKNRGVFVRDILIDEAVEIFDLRAPWTNSRAGSWPEHHAGAAQGNQGPGRRDGEGGGGAGRRRVPPAEPRFHDRLVEMAGNRKLTAIYRKLIKELSLFRRLNLADKLAACRSRRRASRHRQGHRLGRRGRRRPRDVRARDGQPRTRDAQIELRRAPRGHLPRTVRTEKEARRTVNDRTYRARPAADRGRLRRRLRARLPHQAVAGGHMPWLASGWRGHGSSPTAWCRASPTRTTCPSSPARRPRCTASAATTSTTASGTEVMMNDPKYLRAQTHPGRASPTPAPRWRSSPPRTSCAACSGTA